MRDNEKEDARKRGGGGIKEWGAFTIPILSMWKNRGGGRINDGGRSGGTLRYMYYNPPVHVHVHSPRPSPLTDGTASVRRRHGGFGPPEVLLRP